MKKLILLLTIVASILVTGCQDNIAEQEETNNPESPTETNHLTTDEIMTLLNNSGVNTNYNIALEVNPEEKLIQGTVTVYALNDENVDLSNIYFHLYANAFREDAPRENLRAWNSLLGNNAEPGYIEINEVLVNGEKTEFLVDQTILDIPIDWKKNELAVVDLSFELKVPLNSTALSFDSNAIWLGNSLPVKSVYDEDGWNLDPYEPIGDPFYNEMANYQVDITVPEGYQVTNTGVDVKPEATDGKITFKTKVDRVRSYAFIVMNNEYEYKESKSGDVTIRTWYRKAKDSEDAIERFHTASENSIAYFSDAYGQYPYKEYDVIPVRGFFGGMELPGMTLIQGSYFEENNDFGVHAVVHEAAHQWWFHVVGNNQIEDPWMDESLTQYSTFRYLEAFGEENIYDFSYRHLVDSGQIDLFKEIDQLIGNEVSEFSSWDTYGSVIYTVGPQMFKELEKTIGPEKMDEVLESYFANNKFSTVDNEDLIQVFVDEIGPQAKDYFEHWLNNNFISLEQ